MANVYAVIMAGGAGTRFWPASRADRPKQLLPLASGGPRKPDAEGETLLASTVRRLAPVVPAERILIVTGERLAAATAAAVPGVRPEHILREPAPRNTAPCIAWANATIARLDPDAVVIVLPSDHFIADEPGFRTVLERAAASAAAGRVTTVGIVPTRPETGYGYLELGEKQGDVHLVARFVEKPDHARAAEFLAAGPTRFLWNAGMFFFRASDMTALVERHLPGVAAGVARICAAPGDPAVLQTVFPTLESISIDHGVMEKAEGLAVVSGDFGWNDVGSWESAWELATRDEDGNAHAPEDVLVDAKNNLVHKIGVAKQKKKTIALVGVSDLVVVETDDAILVIPRDKAQDVRKVIEALKERGSKELL